MFPSITVADVHAAIAYYLDHREEIEADFQHETEVAEKYRSMFPLKAEGQARWLTRSDTSSTSTCPMPLPYGLRAKSIDVLTMDEAGRASLPDIEHLRFAAAEGRVMATHDADYLVLAAQFLTHGGTVCRRRLQPPNQVPK